jgi:formylglycine-generating enzyme required for sulfatase activity
LSRAATSAPPDPLLATNLLPEIEAWLARQAESALEALVPVLLARIADPGEPLLARISAGNALGILGDPRLASLLPPMCRVPLGRFAMGTDPAEVKSLARRYGLPEAWFAKSTPRHERELDAYEIARYPVTEGDYERYLREEREAARPAHGRDGAPPRYRRNHPVHSLSWPAIVRYTEWLSERTGTQLRVPTEAEWEKAARGTDGRAFPWGDRFEARRCNTREGGVGGTTPVGIYPDGASPFGALDLAGNVEEWTADLYWPYPGTAHEDPAYGSYRVARGGVFCLDADLARCDRRHGPSERAVIGFRLARSAANEWA